MNTSEHGIASSPGQSPVPSSPASLPVAAKVALLTGADAWRTRAVPELGLRQMITSDGPSGARGVALDESDPSSCLPCPSALGATWDVALVGELARALGTEARSKGIDILLGPTINLMRTPLGGRGFECFSEDPLLTGLLGAAFVRGVQATGLAATVKHFIGNDSETERWTYDARIAAHVLRELYLRPFEICVREAGVAVVMAAYNKVNGVPMTENDELLNGVLKGEWGFRGVVVSDWEATRSTVPTAIGGLDLAMPGPRSPWVGELAQAVDNGLVSERTIDDKVSRLLRLAGQVGALGPDGASPEGTSPDGGAGREDGAGLGDGRPTAFIDRELLRRVTAASFVLLRNTGDVLPLDPERTMRLALIGPNAVRPSIQGGGSVTVAPVSVSMPEAALREAAGANGQLAVTVAQGCRNELAVPLPAPESLTDPVTGEPGARFELRSGDGTLLAAQHSSTPAQTWWDGTPDGVGWGKDGTVTLLTRYRPAASGEHVISVAGVGDITASIDGKTVAEGATPVPEDPVQSMVAPPELQATADLTAGQEIAISATLRPASDGAGPLTIRLGIAPGLDDDALIAEAERAAAAADVAIVVIGSPDRGETEGMDRATLALPGRQDELVFRTAAACPRTIVVVNAGMPVLMPWLDRVAAVLYAWLPGQEFGTVLTDVLFGRAEPGGRLPVTLPASEASCPVLHAAPDQGVLRYDEGLLTGYRGYDAGRMAPAFGFGFGLGYTTWSYESLRVPGPFIAGEDLTIEVVVANTGSRAGREVVQAYVEEPHPEPGRPVRILGAFAAATAGPGDRVTVPLLIPARAFARWDETAGGWTWQPGQYRVRVGGSSRDLPLTVAVTSSRPDLARQDVRHGPAAPTSPVRSTGRVPAQGRDDEVHDPYLRLAAGVRRPDREGSGSRAHLVSGGSPDAGRVHDRAQHGPGEIR